MRIFAHSIFALVAVVFIGAMTGLTIGAVTGTVTPAQSEETGVPFRITQAIQSQLSAMISYTPEQQAQVPIPTWIDESHHSCVGVGIEEMLICEVEVLKTHCHSQHVLNQETCLSLSDHYASLYMNRKTFSGWKSRDPRDPPKDHRFHLAELHNRFVSIRKILETLIPACKLPWTLECEVDRITQFCTQYTAETSFPWPACVGGIIESWKK